MPAAGPVPAQRVRRALAEQGLVVAREVAEVPEAELGGGVGDGGRALQAAAHGAALSRSVVSQASGPMPQQT